jgi:CRP-like cAMP-binding protein
MFKPDACIANGMENCEKCSTRPLSPFAALGSQDLHEIDKGRQGISFERKEKVPFDSMKDGGFLCVRRGILLTNLQTGSRTNVVNCHGPGALVGLSPKQKIRLSISSLTAGAACFFSRRFFFNLQARSPAFSLGIIEFLSQINFKREQQIASLENNSVKSRIATMLLDLYEALGGETGSGKIGIDRKTMAELTFTTPETLARVITDLESQGILAREGWNLVIKDKKRLQQTGFPE